jgi:hypothetical protein
MNNIKITVVSKPSEHYSHEWSVAYRGSQTKEEVVESIKKILYGHEYIREVEVE